MNARLVRIGVSLAFAALVAACARGPLLGVLALTITTPAGVVPSVDVTGPGFDMEVSASVDLTGLTPGTYAIDPRAVEIANGDHAGFEKFDADSSTVDVATGQTTDAAVGYAYVGFHIEDADDDADGAIGPYPVFDGIEFSSEVMGDDVVVTIVMREDQDDLSALIGVMDIDVDRDSTTGAVPAMNSFCGPIALGSEAKLTFMPGTLNAVLEISGVEVDVGIVVAANVVEVTLPLATLGSTDGRVHAGLVLGNPDEPTDCVPGGGASL